MHCKRGFTEHKADVAPKMSTPRPLYRRTVAAVDRLAGPCLGRCVGSTALISLLLNLEVHPFKIRKCPTGEVCTLCHACACTASRLDFTAHSAHIRLQTDREGLLKLEQ